MPAEFIEVEHKKSGGRALMTQRQLDRVFSEKGWKPVPKTRQSDPPPTSPATTTRHIPDQPKES